jgi:hypothetical protein
MPCRDYPEHETYLFDYEQAKQRADNLAQLLCAQCRFLEQSGNIGLMHGSVQTWWTKHKEQDRRRLKTEAEEREYNKRLKEWEAKRPKR